MKKTLKIALLIVVLALAVSCTACGLSGLVSSRDGNVAGTEYKLTLELNGGVGVRPSDFVNGKVLVEPEATPTKTGFVFNGWYSNRDCTTPVQFNTVLKSNVTIYAKWTPKTPEATFVFGGGISDQTVEATNGKFVAPEASRTGYTFNGWFTDSRLTQEADFSVAAVDGATFYASWSVIHYTITYVLNGLPASTSGAAQSYTVADAITLASPTGIAAGYDFLYWEDAQHVRQTAIAAGTTGNKTFYAVFTSHNNSIESAVGGKITGTTVTIGVRNSVTEVDFDDVFTISLNATLAVYDSGDNALVGNASALAVGLNSFTAVVTSQSGEEQEYAVSVTRYDENAAFVTLHYPDGSTDSSIGVEKGTKVSPEPTPKALEGRTFVGWYKEVGYVNEFDFAEEFISDDTDVYAKYDLTVYNITYYYGIGSEPVNAVYTYTIEDTAEGALPLPAAVAPTGYTFNGYTDGTGAAKVSIEQNGIGDVVVYAHYLNGKTDTAYSHAFVAGTSESRQSLTRAQLVDYFNWAIANRKDTVYITMSDTCPITELVGTGPQQEDSALSRSNVLVSSVGAQYSYTYDGDNLKTADITFTYVEPNRAKANSDYYTQFGYNAHAAHVQTRANDYEHFAINYIDTPISVTNTDQLVYAAVLGYRPVPTVGSPAEEMYAAAKAVLRQIIDDEMTDMQKAHVIFDWLLENVVYDKVLFDNAGGETTAELKEYNGFYLEGVFTDRRAVCDGISKAYALMCNIEGISCVQISGHMTDTHGGHAWNKVYLDGHWYVVDPTHGDTHIGVREVYNHEYFLMTDDEREETAIPDDYTDLVADTAHDVYADITFAVDATVYDMVITSRDELTALLTYFGTICASHLENQTIDVRMAYSYTNIESELSATNGGFDWTHYSLSYSGGAESGDNLILIATLKE